MRQANADRALAQDPPPSPVIHQSSCWYTTAYSKHCYNYCNKQVLSSKAPRRIMLGEHVKHPSHQEPKACSTSMSGDQPYALP